jgi:hypothetical protein
VRDPRVVRAGLAACRRALRDTGLLIVQDARLTSVTTLVCGEAVRGSWWGHEQAHSIFDVLQELYDEAAVAKLVAAKQTLVHRSLWPSLVGAGNERAAWQLEGLRHDARSALTAIDAEPAPVRADQLAVASTRKIADVVRDLERRLLVASNEVHTETGRHVKVVQPWEMWAASVGIDAFALPNARDARQELEAAARRLDPDGARPRLPWPADEG